MRKQLDLQSVLMIIPCIPEINILYQAVQQENARIFPVQADQLASPTQVQVIRTRHPSLSLSEPAFPLVSSYLVELCNIGLKILLAEIRHQVVDLPEQRRCERHHVSLSEGRGGGLLPWRLELSLSLSFVGARASFPKLLAFLRCEELLAAVPE